jgi:hypothetical protein
MRGGISPLPRYVFMAWCLVKHRDNFTFYHSKYDYEVETGFGLIREEKKKNGI